MGRRENNRCAFPKLEAYFEKQNKQQQQQQNPQYKNVSTSLAEWGKKSPGLSLRAFDSPRKDTDGGVKFLPRKQSRGGGGVSAVLSTVTPFKDYRLQNPELGQPPTGCKRSSFTNKHTKTTKT